jgi:hypothetical protein
MAILAFHHLADYRKRQETKQPGQGCVFVQVARRAALLN